MPHTYDELFFFWGFIEGLKVAATNFTMAYEEHWLLKENLMTLLQSHLHLEEEIRGFQGSP